MYSFSFNRVFSIGFLPVKVLMRHIFYQINGHLRVVIIILLLCMSISISKSYSNTKCKCLLSLPNSTKCLLIFPSKFSLICSCNISLPHAYVHGMILCLSMEK